MSNQEIIDNIKRNKKFKLKTIIDSNIDDRLDLIVELLKEINKVVNESPLNCKSKDYDYVFEILEYLEYPSSITEKDKIIKELSIILERCKKRISKIPNNKKINKFIYIINDNLICTLEKIKYTEVKDKKNIVFYNFFHYLIYETKNFFQITDIIKISNKEIELKNEDNTYLINELVDTYLEELKKDNNKENILYYEKIIKYFLSSPNFIVDAKEKNTISYIINKYISEIKEEYFSEEKKKSIIFHSNELLGFMLGNPDKIEIENELYSIANIPDDDDLIIIHPIIKKLQTYLNDDNCICINNGDNSVIITEISKLKINKEMKKELLNISKKIFAFLYQKNKNNNYREHLNYKYSIIDNDKNDIDEKKIQTYDNSDYYDYTDKFVITIDGSETNVYDDAMSLEKLPNGNTILGVYLADASSLVKKDTEMDENALKLSETIYMPNSNHLMLPPNVTKNLSLLDDGKKRTIGFFFVFDKNMKCIEFAIRKCLIKISTNLDYDEADRYLLNKDKKDELNMIIDMLKISNKISLTNNFNNNIIECVQLDENISSKLVANIMVYTNYKIAQYFNQHKELPFIYRNNVNCINDKFKKNINQITKVDYEIKRIIDQTCLNISSCFYSESNLGHQNLNLDAYCQATNPIRNYASLEIQRIIDKYIIRKESVESLIDEQKRIKDICDYLNKRMDLNREYVEETKKVKKLIR